MQMTAYRKDRWSECLTAARVLNGLRVKLPQKKKKKTKFPKHEEPNLFLFCHKKKLIATSLTPRTGYRVFGYLKSENCDNNAMRLKVPF